MRWAIGAAFFALLVLTHAPYLRLPYFWDELGQFIPQSLDLLQLGAWIPVTTTPNIHPPGVIAYLALVWQTLGGGQHSILLTRLAMLLLAAFGALGCFLLSIRLGRTTPGYPAIAAILLLFASPLFYAQSMLAQLDMPAMVFTVWALLLFFEERYAWSAAACTALVLCKETGAILPAILAAYLVWRRPAARKWAGLYALSILPLFIWIFTLWRLTGNPLGDTQFAQYNAVYSLHPVRLAAAILRRIHYLFFAEFRWIGLIGILLARRVFQGSIEWAIAAAFTAAHILTVSVFGGAVLERYLLPVLPVVYAAMGVAFAALPPARSRFRIAAPAVLVIGQLVSIFWGPPYFTPFENNIAFTDFVQLHEEAAVFLNRLPERPRSIATAWPLTDALRRPAFGFTPRGFENVIETSDFRRASVEQALARTPAEVVVVYDRLHEPGGLSLVRDLPWISGFLTAFYGYAPQVTQDEMLRLGYIQQIRIEQRGQWIAIYATRRKSM